MKTYEEKACSALWRIAEEKEKKRRNQQMTVRIALPVVSICLIAALGIALRGAGAQETNPALDMRGIATVYTPSISLPDSADMAADMIGCLVYKGHVYTRTVNSGWDFSGDLEALVDEYLGEATGTLNEWSKQEDWSAEFASTYHGAVYTVKGYSADFRLCVRTETADGGYLVLLDNYDHIALQTGADLFDTRLHIPGNIESIGFLTHEQWNAGYDTFTPLDGITDEQFDEFITLICESPIVKIDHVNNDRFYDTEKQGHLYLSMKDGTTVELRLMDGGYVGNQDLGWIFVKAPGELFDAVLNACQ